MKQQNQAEASRPQRYLSPLTVWALSLGCAVGWGAFVMPGTTFLPKAGPWGTAIGIVLGALVMLVIGINYHYMMNQYPQNGGTLTFATRAFGYDHGFLSAWFLLLVYIAVAWANATALALLGRNLFGSLFQIGFHYQVLDYDVYLGEALISVAAIIFMGMICARSRNFAVTLQTILALLLCGGILICFFVVMSFHSGEAELFVPAFAPESVHPIRQIGTIIVLSPWAFVGFESISHSVENFKFPVKRSILVMSASLLAGSLCYIFLTFMAASTLPEGIPHWPAYIAQLSHQSGLAGLPTFFSIHTAWGNTGLLILGIAVLSAVLTGLIGNFYAVSRLMCAMAREDILPRRFSELNSYGNPEYALKFLIAISVFITFLGRTAIGWIVDVNTIGATIDYAYTSASAFRSAIEKKDRLHKLTGLTGLAFSAVFFFYFMAFSSGAMTTESYLILAFWSILGFIYFRFMFVRDEKRHFGQSTVVWIGLLFLIFFTTLMWVRQSTNEMTAQVISNISHYYETKNPTTDRHTILATEEYMSEQLSLANQLLARNYMIQMVLIMVALGIMFNIYTTISRRERQMEVEKYKAEESNKAKTTFLSNMSHDIRTPMNAIIGYINLAEQENADPAKVMDYLGKIKTSSHHLLALINDVLEMSRIESGKMDLEPIPIDLTKTLSEVRDMFSTQMDGKRIDFTVDTSQVQNGLVYCDKNRLNRVLLNLLSNAYKFTPEDGSISVTLWQIEDEDPAYGRYELRVKDSGIGMTEEFAAKVFEAFERERTSTVSGIQGTGLGMAITKSIIDLMDGSIEVITKPDQGTEFVIRLRFRLQEKPAEVPMPSASASASAAVDKEAPAAAEEDTDLYDFSGMRILLVDDIEMNREIASFILSNMGFEVETATNGKEAVEKVATSEPGYFAGVLMDIQMPVMNGHDATKAIRELNNSTLSGLPVIAMTANAFSEDARMALDAGMNDHIAKPIDIEDLKSKLVKYLK